MEKDIFAKIYCVMFMLCLCPVGKLKNINILPVKTLGIGETTHPPIFRGCFILCN